MGGKKWCDYCRINIDYNKKAIQQHQETRLHIQNKDRQIKFEKHKIRKEAKEKRMNTSDRAGTKVQAKPIGGAPGLGTTNPPVAPTFTQPKKPKIDEEKLAQITKQQNEFKASAMSKIHALIAQKTRGQFGAPVEFPQENPLLIKDTYYDKPDKPKKPKLPKVLKKEEQGDESDEEEDSEDDDSDDDSEDIQMWKIELCEETGKACFINNITGAKLYEKPKGVMLTERELALWDELQQFAEQNPKKDPQQQVNIGQWEQVPDHQNIFITNAVPESQSSHSDLQQMPDIIRPKTKQQQQLQCIQQKISTGQIKTAGQVVDMMILAGTETAGESLRQKNAKLKKLIENNFQQTAQMNRDKKDEQEEEDEEYRKAKEGFKPRRKVKVVKLTNQEDLY